MVEMGTDRMHHGFWKDMDPRTSPEARSRRANENAILDYHRHVDGLVGGLLDHADEEDGAVLVVFTTAPGGIGRRSPSRRVATAGGTSGDAPGAFHQDDADRGRYRLVEDRGLGRRRVLRRTSSPRRRRAGSPEGTIPEAEYESVRNDLAERLGAIPDENGDPLDTKVYKPDEIYEEVNGVAPDLIVHFDDLEWRAVGTIGGDEGIHTFENDTGPDDANHAQDGLLIMAGPGIPAGYRGGHAPARRRPDRSRSARAGHTGDDEGSKPRRGRRRASNRDSERGRRIVNPHAAPYVRFWWLVVIGVVVACLAGTAVVYHIEPGMPPKLTERTPPSYSATAILMLTSKEQPLVRIGVTTVTPRGPGGAPGPPDVETSPPGLDTLVEAANLLPLTIQSDAVTDLRREEVGDLPGTVTAQALYAHETPAAASSHPTSRPSRSRPNRPRPRMRFNSSAARPPRSEPGSASSRTRRRCRRPSGSSSSSSTRRQLPATARLRTGSRFW